MDRTAQSSSARLQFSGYPAYFVCADEAAADEGLTSQCKLPEYPQHIFKCAPTRQPRCSIVALLNPSLGAAGRSRFRSGGTLSPSTSFDRIACRICYHPPARSLCTPSTSRCTSWRAAHLPRTRMGTAGRFGPRQPLAMDCAVGRRERSPKPPSHTRWSACAQRAQRPSRPQSESGARGCAPSPRCADLAAWHRCGGVGRAVGACTVWRVGALGADADGAAAGRRDAAHACGTRAVR